MKNLFVQSISCLFIVAIVGSTAIAQESPAESASASVDGVKVEINYHSPRVKGRTIWGGLEPYDKVWRTGANNATTIEFGADMKVGNNKIPKGKYALFTIPKKGESWTVIFNKEAEQWGAYNYKEDEDLCRFDVKVGRTLELQENLMFNIEGDGIVTFAWEYKTFSFKVEK